MLLYTEYLIGGNFSPASCWYETQPPSAYSGQDNIEAVLQTASASCMFYYIFNLIVLNLFLMVQSGISQHWLR